MLENAFYTYLERPARRSLRDLRPRRSRLRRHPDERRADTCSSAALSPSAAVQAAMSRRTTSRPSTGSAEFAERVRAASAGSRSRAAASRTSSASPTDGAGRSSATPATRKDPITAQGISDAFRVAELCAAALDETFRGERSFDDAMADYQRRATPTSFRSTSSPPSSRPSSRRRLRCSSSWRRRTAARPAMDAFVSVTAGAMSPTEFFDPVNVTTILGSAA